MPLCYVTDHGERASKREALLADSLGEDLPHLLTRHKQTLHLEEQTEPAAVQVTFHQYGERDINTARIWLKVEFTEKLGDEENGPHIRDRFRNILDGWLDAHLMGSPKQPEMAIDLIWVDGWHGYMTDENGKVTFVW